MPRYDYKCEGGHKYELQQPFGSPTEHDCQKCGKPARRVTLVAPPLVFKASGYYKTSGRDLSSGSSEIGSKRSSKPEKKLSDDSSPKATEKKAKRADRVKAAD